MQVNIILSTGLILADTRLRMRHVLTALTSYKRTKTDIRKTDKVLTAFDGYDKLEHETHQTIGERMITNTQQTWTPGSIVKIGFLLLRVESVRAVKDFLPDIYTLTSLDGCKQYEFTPYNGLVRR